MLYSYKGGFPKELPFRIRLSDGRRRTDPTSFTADELADAGYVAAPKAPSHDPVRQRLDWNGTAYVAVDRLPERKAEMRSASDEECKTRRAKGTTASHGGVGYPVDTAPDAMADLRSEDEYLNRPGAKANIRKLQKSGDVLTMTKQVSTAKREAGDSYLADCTDRHGEIIEAINAAANHDALDLIDIKSGWPA